MRSVVLFYLIRCIKKQLPSDFMCIKSRLIYASGKLFCQIYVIGLIMLMAGVLNCDNG